MKRSKLWKIIWMVGIYAILAIILYLVILYKVEWEHKDLNTYIYFYDCNNSLCTSTTNQDDYYSKTICEENTCPHIIDIIDNKNLILKKDNNSWIYNYIEGKTVNNDYKDYKHTRNNIFIVTNENNKQGVIDLEGNILVEFKYEYIDDFNNGFISYKENNLYGINTTDESHNINANFEKIVLINDDIFAAKKDNLYQIYEYNNLNTENNENTYNYIYSYNNVILVIKDNKIDILDSNLDSTLLMKIDTTYEYTIEKERESLDIYTNEDYIYFKVFINNNEYMQYKYNIEDKKISN